MGRLLLVLSTVILSVLILIAIGVFQGMPNHAAMSASQTVMSQTNDGGPKHVMKEVDMNLSKPSSDAGSDTPSAVQASGDAGGTGTASAGAKRVMAASSGGKVENSPDTMQNGAAHQGHAGMAGHAQHAGTGTVAAGADLEAHAHAQLDVSDLDNPPDLEIAIVRDPMSGWNLNIKTSNFEFAPGRVNGKPLKNEGHAHIYINSRKLARVYGDWFHIPALPKGRHVIEVTLNANDHSELAVTGNRISRKAIIEER